MGPEPVSIEFLPYSTQLSMTFVLLININLSTFSSFFLFSFDHETYPVNKYKMSTKIGILISISRTKFMLMPDVHRESFITTEPGVMI